MLRKLGLIIVALLPFNVLRRGFYRLFFNYRIDKASRIGMLNYIDCKDLELINANIGFLNLLIIHKLELKSGAYINNRNRVKNINHILIKEKGFINKSNFIGGAKPAEPGFKFEDQNLFIGQDSEVNRHNYFDIVQAIHIGNNVVFGGEGSEIWTHGFETNRTMLTGGVTFGDNIFIGSKCIFTKGVTVANGVTIGPGSVIYKSITESGLYSTHQIVKIR